MPRKFGINSKSAEAWTRKEAVKQAEKEKKEREVEDALWRDDDKHVLRKTQRKEGKEKKKQEQLDKKLANKQAYEEEMSSVKSAKLVATKVTRAEISDMLDKTKEKAQKVDKPKFEEAPLEENVNKLIVEGETARSVEEAIAVLSINDPKVDRHPEKRMKAAYQEFEDRNLPRLKAENPNLRLSQLKQMLKKDWMKSPDNPMNQRHLMYNTPK